MESSLLISRDLVLHTGADAFTSRHSMMMAKLVVPLDAPLHYSEHEQSTTTQIDGPVVVAPNHKHVLGSHGRFLALFVHPQDAFGVYAGTVDAGIQDLVGRRGQRADGLARRLLENVEHADLASVLDELHTALELDASPALDPRVAEAQRLVCTSLQIPSLDDLADAVGLSRYYLSRLFRRETGTTLRRYLLWEKLVRGVRHLAEGKSITEAAHAASFADHAHMTRTMRKMAGQPPSYAV